MNYYSSKKKQPDYWYGHQSCRQMQCCASAEAVVEYATGTAKNRVESIIDHSLFGNRTWLHWTLLPGTSIYDEVEKIVKNLPATTFLGEHVNKNSGHVVRAYVTNLQQEWA